MASNPTDLTPISTPTPRGRARDAGGEQPEDREDLPPAPGVDITETRLWTHPVNQNMLSAEGILSYRNMQVLADMHRQTHRLLERLIAAIEKSSRDSTYRSRSRSQSAKGCDTQTHEQDGSDEGSDDQEVQVADDQGTARKKERRRASQAERTTVSSSAKELHGKGMDVLEQTYKDWIDKEERDVRQTRSKTNDLSVDCSEFFGNFLTSSKHINTHTEIEFVKKLADQPGPVMEELYLLLGRAFAKNEPALTKKAGKRRQFRQSSSGRRSTGTEVSAAKEASVNEGSAFDGHDDPEETAFTTPIRQVAQGTGLVLTQCALQHEDEGNLSEGLSRMSIQPKTSNKKRKGKTVSLQVGPNETRHPASSPVSSDARAPLSDVEAPPKRLRGDHGTSSVHNKDGTADQDDESL